MQAMSAAAISLMLARGETMSQDETLSFAVTQALSNYVAEAEPDALPEAVRNEVGFVMISGCTP